MTAKRSPRGLACFWYPLIGLAGPGGLWRFPPAPAGRCCPSGRPRPGTGHRPQRGRAAAVVQQRHLAQNRAGADLGHRLAVDLHLQYAVEEQEQFLPGLALLDQGPARPQPPELCPTRKWACSTGGISKARRCTISVDTWISGSNGDQRLLRTVTPIPSPVPRPADYESEALALSCRRSPRRSTRYVLDGIGISSRARLMAWSKLSAMPRA